MRALPVPIGRQPQRTAAVQSMSEPPSSLVATKRGTVKPSNTRYLAGYQDWQDDARRFARSLGPARFAASVRADACARCILRIEERQGQDWVPSEDARLTDELEAYRNPRQDTSELVRLHAWHYGVAGEMAQVVVDGQQGLEWWIFSLAAIQWQRGEADERQALVQLVPGGKAENGTAFVVPAAQVVRFWRPDEEWQAYATSSMTASIEDLQRWRSMARYAQRVADSALAMNGVLWIPGEAMEAKPTAQSETSDEPPRSAVLDAYYDMARVSFEDDDDVAAIAPPVLWWDKNLGKPEWTKISDGLDESGIAHREEALRDFARGGDLPAALVVGGGPGEGNHWTDWLVDDKFFDSAIAPTMDTITHADLTATFLPPLLRLYGIANDGRYRIGYDPAPVIVEADQSDDALKAYALGLLSDDATLQAIGFTASEVQTPEGRARLLEVLAKGAAGGGAPVTMPGPTARDTPPGAPPGGPPMAAQAAAGPPSTERTQRLLDQLQRMRSQLGQRLLSGAEVAYAEAARRAGVKVLSRSKARASRSQDQAVQAAVHAGEPLRPLLAAIGLQEGELLAGAFDTYQDQAQRWIAESQARQRRAIARAGYEPDDVLGPETEDDDRSKAAALLLVASLLALVRGRLLAGVDPTTLGSDGQPVHAGEVTGAVPAVFVTNALQVVDGIATATPPSTPDELPHLARIPDARTPREQLARQALDAVREERAQNLERARERGATVEELEAITAEGEADQLPIYTWTHGFYGEPSSPFEPHEVLDGLETDDPTGDPQLANSETFPDGDLYQPGDHNGCTCEWVISLPFGGQQVQLRLDAPELV